MAQIAVVIGAGPGLGASVAARFAREGFSVGVVARKQETLAPAVERIGAAARAYAADTTDTKDQTTTEQTVLRVRCVRGGEPPPAYFAYLFRGSLPTMCSTSWLFSLQMYSISSVSI